MIELWQELPDIIRYIIILFTGILLASIYWRLVWISRYKHFKLRSRSVLKGRLNEQIAPYLPNFPAPPTEAKFIGQPIDFIVFNGLDTGEVTEIIFIEVKSGKKKRLSSVERSIRQAVQSGSVSWIQYDWNPQ
ncbi:hypothetical protein JW979_05480 [bacterium]|nr:hypothetical protein [candidate division CSSED10-310 bacterium]